MAEWKKVVVSGSAISQLQNDSNYLVSGDSGVELTGSFKGDGSQLTGVTSDQTGEALTDGSGISDFTFDGSTAVSISVQNDGSTLTVGGGGVKVTDAGITATQLAASVAGNGLSGGAGTALSVNTDGTSITTSGDSLTLAGTAFSSSVDSRIDANASAIAGLDGNYATDAELSAVSSSASADATSKADAAQAAAIASAEAKDVVRAAAANAYADQAEVDAIASAEAKDVVRAAAANAYADQAELDAVSTANSYTDTEVSSLSGSAHTQRVAIETSLDGKIGTEKGRIDAILTASVADTDTFAEIVSLINSVDTTNDQAFAGFVTSSNGRATAIEGSVTSLSGSAAAANALIISDVSANSASIAALDGNYATDSSVTALSGSAHIARASVASDASAARLVLENSVEFTTDALQENIDQNTQVIGTNMQAINSISTVAIPQVFSQIGTEKARIDAILSASVADTDSFAEIVSLINSVDTTNDSAFAGFVTSSNGRATAIEGSVTSLSGSAAAANALIISDVSANSASIAALDGNYATDSSVTALSGSAHIARASVASDASAARLVLENSVEFTTDALQENIDQNTQVIGTNMQAINSISTVAIPQVFSQIGTEKARIDAILSASVADTDSFAEIVSLINSVDTTNDQAFAGFVTSSNAAQAVQDGRLTSIEAFTASIDAAYASEGQLTALSSSAAAANAAIIVNVSSNALDIEELYTFNEDHDDRITAAQSLATTNSAFIATNTAAIGDLEDGISATDSSVTALSGSAHTARGVVASNATGEVSALSGSANIARGVVASNAYNTTLAVSSSILVVTDALDGRIDTLEGVSHSHSNKANLDQINQDLGTSDNVNFNDLVVDGNLTVSGTTTTVNTANLLVEDKFILLNSGSADPDEGGIIIDEGAGSGHAFIYDKGDTRWGFNASVAQDASTANATAHAAAVVDMQNVAHADSAEYQKNGNIKVDAGSIFIYC